MFNVGGGELLVIFLVALIVLGPTKLPDVARQLGGVMREVRRISSGFQEEMRAAMDDPVESAARERGNRVVTTSESPAPDAGIGDGLDDDDDPDHPEDDTEDLESPDTAGPEGMSTAAAAGMYDVASSAPKSTPNPYLAPVGTRAQPAEADDHADPARPGDEAGDPMAEATDEPAAGADASDRSDPPAGSRDDAESADGTTDERG